MQDVASAATARSSSGTAWSFRLAKYSCESTSVVGHRTRCRSSFGSQTSNRSTIWVLIVVARSSLLAKPIRMRRRRQRRELVLELADLEPVRRIAQQPADERGEAVLDRHDRRPRPDRLAVEVDQDQPRLDPERQPERHPSLARRDRAPRRPAPSGCARAVDPLPLADPGPGFRYGSPVWQKIECWNARVSGSTAVTDAAAASSSRRRLRWPGSSPVSARSSAMVPPPGLPRAAPVSRFYPSHRGHQDRNCPAPPASWRPGCTIPDVTEVQQPIT